MKFLTLATALIALTVTALAQHDSPKASIQNMRAVSAIPVLAAGGAEGGQRISERLRHKDRAVTLPPEPLDTARYVSLSGRKPSEERLATSPNSSGGKDLAAPDLQLDYLKLTPKRPFSSWGSLQFNEPRHYTADGDYVIFYGATDPQMAFSRAWLKVRAGEKYLVDVSVSTKVDNTFHLSAGGPPQQIAVGKGAHHLLAYLEAGADEELGIMLWPERADYTFYALEVTRVQ